ncbi:MAG: DUF2382 domain-containing protein [Pleurocapsa minor HA4230-MV1]|jgi:uncharacterized protein (TIGR02271 family)|nr:DUF2382 domain-containing protein [Pleurocapsa minor HA4230-MV1]
MKTKQYKRAAGLFYSRDEAESAVRDLKAGGYDMDQVSVIAKDADRVAGHETTEKIGNKADEGATTGALTGGTLGGITGLLVGLGALAIPGLGPILLAGAEATAIATTLAGAGIGAAAGSLIGALIGLGIPEEKAKIYSDRVGRGSFLVIVTGTELEIDRAATIMRQHGVEEFDIYDMPGAKVPAVTNVTDVDKNMRARTDLGDMPGAKVPAVTNVTDVDEDLRARTDLSDVPKAKAIAITDVDEDIRARTDLGDRDKIKLYEERLLVNKHRVKAGEVSIGKHVETETAEVAVPVKKERIVIERSNAVNTTPVDSGTVDFTDAETIRMEAYEEKPKIQKEAFVREEVNIHKEIEQDTVNAQETIRHEELDIKADGDVIQR